MQALTQKMNLGGNLKRFSASKRLLKALSQVFNGAAHYYCIEHLKNNLRDRFKGGKFSGLLREHLVWLLDECARAPTQSLFNERIALLRKKGGGIVNKFLKDLPFDKWTNAFARVCRYGEMSSNAAESYNAWIVDARSLAITSMIDLIRVKLMTWFCERREKALRWNTFLCPKMDVRLRDLVLEGKSWNLKRSSKTLFEVMSDPSVMVDIDKRVCSCRQWQLDGFPCAHAVLAIGRSGMIIDDFVDKSFHKSAYLKVYEGLIHPIPTFSMQEDEDSEGIDILPPITKRQAGRPRKRRFRSRGERVNPVTCSRCGKVGHHNRKTCKEPISY